MKNYKIIKNNEVVLQNLGNGVSRKVLAYNDNLMTVEVYFESDAIGSKHKHIHFQNTYVKEGVFEFEIENERVIVSAGDTIAFGSLVEHGVKCIEKGILIDTFNPLRKDFI